MVNGQIEFSRNGRWGEPIKFLPIFFVSSLILGLFSIFNIFHCLPLLQLPKTQWEGILTSVVFNTLASLMVGCYVKCILTHPGTIPETDGWRFHGNPDSRTEDLPQGLQEARETKKSGDRRVCKWCQKFKPDRCHHCRVCRLCILKMDHHCPWIYNCVGYHNYKYFFLLLVYAVILCWMIFLNIQADVWRALQPSEPFVKMVMVLFGTMLSGFLMVVLTLFFSFHTYLMLQALTTIEFCEKSLSSTSSVEQQRNSWSGSVYSLGMYDNVKAVLGPNPLFWFVPISLPPGDGLRFPIQVATEETPLLQDAEKGRRPRRRPRQAGTGCTENDTWTSPPESSRSCSPNPDPFIAPESPPHSPHQTVPEVAAGDTGGEKVT